MVRQSGVKFERTITIGRLDLLLTERILRQTFASFGEVMDEEEAKQTLFDADRFAEPLFKRLGAATVDSLDASGFEGATIVHDLNQPIPPSLACKFSLVFDGGTLEHVFDFPRAISNVMKLAAPGGHVIISSPANNEMGHGFYQFSPDLFYRVFSPQNGYELENLFLVPAYTSDPRWYRVWDPAKVGSRVGYNHGSVPLHLYAIARKVETVPLFSRPPQQQDYSVEWVNRAGKAAEHSRLQWFDDITARAEKDYRRFRRLKRLLRSLAPPPVRNWGYGLRQTRQAMQSPNPAHFEPYLLPPVV